MPKKREEEEACDLNKKRMDFFFEVAKDFAYLMVRSFPKCSGTKDYSLYLNNVVLNSEKEKVDFVKAMHTNLKAELPKGSVKYYKAVLSITGSAPTVYHAVKYRDAKAADETCSLFQDLDLCSKVVNEEKKNKKEGNVLGRAWDLIEEMASICFKISGDPPPRAPSPEEIDADIKKRKKMKDSPFVPGLEAANTLSSGVKSLWDQLIEMRRGKKEGEEENTDFDGLCKRISTMPTTDKRCGKTEEEILLLFPELGEGKLREEEWDVLEKMNGLIAMESAIPQNMMRGIEGAAAKLAKGITSGNLNMEDIDIAKLGESVLEGVDEKELEAFASNMQKIVPMLEKMRSDLEM